ncbi:cell cycle checkpoint control protein RAD9A [Anoplophora glabripennis]|uniref:cell cycle checkpoint control protein RAD9A n=1 Tax=Anoplophora glabripennis TaxID=217634 RepID=UPI000873D2B2|nr:cell cycle checkpoint control protein RAD9A [Anoplophora glabripennis]
MNCILPGLNIKVLSKAIHALAKVGDDLYLEAHEDRLTLITLNLRKTICVRYHLLDSFFSNYEVNKNELNEQCSAITCKIHMKILLPLFKGAHLEKKLEFIKLEYESDSDVIIFKMKFKCDDILMTHRLRLMETESLSIEFKPDAGSNNILGSSSFFNQLLTMFSNTDDEITFEISKEKVVVRNYIVGATVTANSVRSQVNLNRSEFSKFEINKETAINFCLRPLRTAIQFAEGFNLNIGINFEVGGKPLTLIMKNPTFEVNFIVATLNPYSDLQSSMATSSIPTKITQLAHENINLSLEDRQALNEEWDDWEMDTEENNPKRAKLDMNIKKDKNRKGKGKCKKFNLPSDPVPMDVDGEDMDVLPPSPESPRTKKAKLVFGRCFEPTFTETSFGEVLAPNSDSE